METMFGVPGISQQSLVIMSGLEYWITMLALKIDFICAKMNKGCLILSQVWPYGSSVYNVCPNIARIGDGTCDWENQDAACNFDGGDCCPNADRIGDGICDEENKNKVCDFDGLDCCQNWQSVDDWICNAENNNQYCDFDKEDCCVFQWSGDGICHDVNNNPLCGPYDGGDCCLDDPITDYCSDCNCHEDYVSTSNVSKTIFSHF